MWEAMKKSRDEITHLRFLSKGVSEAICEESDKLSVELSEYSSKQKSE